MLKKKAEYHAVSPYGCVQTGIKALQKHKPASTSTVHRNKVTINQR
jgi:hypothetical protein